MRSPLKHALLILTSIALISCGGDDNKVNTNAAPGNGSTTNYGGSSNQTVGQGELPAVVSQLASELAGSLNCPYGKRVTNYQQYYVQSQGDHTKICGSFQQGVMPGEAGQKYVGVSAYNDFMIITEVLNGNQIVGHNMIVSMCAQYINYYGSQLPLIGDERQLSGFQAPNCVVLDKDSFCPHGVVDAAINTYQVSSSYQFNVNGMQGNLNPYEVWTTFFKPTCNGQF
jgi:hypothetical protein